ncbi:MAG: ABC transporter permease [Nanoarchaeota archaeon]
MNLADHFIMTIRSLTNRKMRTALTLIGTFIGVAAVVALVSLGQGLQDAIAAEFAKSGGDKIFVQAKSGNLGPPGVSSSGRIENHDIDVIERVNGIDKAGGHLMRPTQIGFNKRTQAQYAMSIPTDDSVGLVLEAFALEIDQGRMLKRSDRGKVVVGANFVNNDLFGKEVQIGSTVIVNNTPFKVAGILKTKGDPTTDNGVVMNEDDLRQVMGLDKNVYDVIFARSSRGFSPEEVAPNVMRALRRDRGEKEGSESVEVQTFSEVLQSFNAIFNIVQVVLVGIALISFVVGAVGIMNTMYTSVVERTREIGIMKAVGASNAQIVTMFFVESGIIGFMGGALGAAIGAAMSKLVEIAAGKAFGSPLIHASYPPALIIGSILLATIIGVIAGFLPALQASHQKPVDAIRYD